MYHPIQFSQSQAQTPAYILADSGEEITYKTLAERICKGSQLFRSLNINHGDHIAILMENNSWYLSVIWAAQSAGLYYTCISTSLSAEELEFILNDCKARLLITSPKASQRLPQTHKLPFLEYRLMVQGLYEGFESYEFLLEQQKNQLVSEACEGRQMLYSSGTTGRPKGVLLPLSGRKIGEADPFSEFMKSQFHFGPATMHYIPTPLYHAAPMVYCLAATRSGGTVVISEKFNELEVLSILEKYQISHTQWVPTMFVKLLKLPEELRAKFDPSHLKMVMHGAAPCPIPIKEAMISWWGPVLEEYYSGSEGCGVSVVSSEEWLQKKGTVGKPIIGTPHIVDEDGNELATGEIGNIYWEGGEDFSYNNDPAKTQKAYLPNGWSTYGDIGYLDKDGYLFLVDRQNDLMIIGGVNVYPQEAEDLLISHELVRDAAVFGIPHPEYGEEVKAIVQLLNQDQLRPDLETQLIEYCRQKLAKVKCPRSVEFRDYIPRTASGKLLRRILKEEYRSSNTIP